MRIRVVFVQATRRVERDEELFSNYGTGFLFPQGVIAICVGVIVATSRCHSVKPKPV